MPAGTPLAMMAGVIKVLLVDDDPGVRFALTEVLRDRGFGVVSVGSGAQALASLTGVDVVVTDLSMPADGGIDTAQQLMKIKPGIPVVLSGSYIKPEIERRAFACGIRAAIEKTASVRELCAALDRALRPS